MQSLRNKVVIVTGASSGIGLATAERLLGVGAKVFGCDISPEPPTLSSSSNFRFLRCDLSKDGSPEEIVRGCQDQYGGSIHSLLNIAGIMDTYTSVDHLTDAGWDKTLAINLTAPVKLMRAVVPVMIQGGGGSIVNVSSKAGLSGSVAGVAYTASKHGIIGATKNVAFRFRDQGIRCNAICPGGVDTNIQKSIDISQMDEGGYELMKPVHNLGRMGKPESFAKVLTFLASDESSEINGAIIPVDQAWGTI